MNISSIKTKCKYAACVLACLVLLLAAGCEDAPDGTSFAESSTAVSMTSSAAEESSLEISSEDSGVSDESDESMIELPSEDISAEASSEEVSEETSSMPEKRPIYRDDDEPHLEEIVLPAIREQGFALVQDRMTVEIGERFQIPYEFTPIGTTNRKLTWTSTNTKAVTVSADGTLTAVGKGITYIRATTVTGRYAECKVEVVDELPYTELAKRIKAVADGEFGGLHFALCDIDLDGVQELIARRTPAEGLPRVDIYEIEVEESSEEISDESEEISDESEEISDESADDTSSDVSEESEEPMPEGWVLGFDTGDDEEWAVWERKDGTRFLLVSFSQKAENGDVRHVMLEVTLVQPAEDETADEEQAPVLQCVYILTREVKNGQSTYYALQNGVFAECDNDTYQAVRTAYFADNKQQNGYALTWVNGSEPKAIEKELEELIFVKK